MPTMPKDYHPEDGSPKDPRFLAAVDFVPRLGASTFGIRYQDDQEPVIWCAAVEFPGGAAEAAGALTPLLAVTRLLDLLVDGGHCKHCNRPTGITFDWQHTMPLDNLVCWYQYDPETKAIRRGCEGD